MNRPRRAPLAKLGASLAVAGIILLGVGALGNASCDFDTMNRCAAFGVWSVEPFVLQGGAGLVMILGLAAGGLGAILILARLARLGR